MDFNVDLADMSDLLTAVLKIWAIFFLAFGILVYFGVIVAEVNYQALVGLFFIIGALVLWDFSKGLEKSVAEKKKKTEEDQWKK